MSLRVRSAVAEAVGFLQERAGEDEEGWVVSPKRTRKVVDHEVVIHRYREEIREIPIYKYEYEEYEVVQKVRVGQSSDAVDTYRKVKKRRVVSRKQVDVKKVKRLVRDPDGPIEREHRIPKYGPGGPDIWPRYALGDNALALYALRRSGVSVDDATVGRLVSSLDRFLNHYGYPDETWDLAWLTAAYATLPYESHKRTARILAAKLLDGQIREGGATGLWGPVSINTTLLAERVFEVEELSVKLQAAKKISGNGKREERAFNRIDKAYRQALADLMRVATFGMAGHTIEVALTMKPEFGPSARLAGLYDYIYNQRTADLGCTALALYALRQAADYGTFPEKLWRPDSSQVEAESPAELLRASTKVLATKLVEKRGWDEMNHYQPVKSFDKVGVFPGVPGAQVAFPKVASRTNLLTMAQGFTSMATAIRGTNSEALRTKYSPHLGKGLELFRASAESLLKNSSKESSPWQLEPYEHYLFLSEVTRRPGSSKEDRRDLWEPLANHVLAMRSVKGSWEHKGPGRRFHLPTSLMARLAVMEEPDQKAPIKYEQPHAHRGYHALAASLLSGKKLRQTVEEVVPTAFAMIFLAENVRPPIIGECLWNEESKESKLTPLVASVMRKKKGVPVRYSAVMRPVQSEQLAELPVLLIKGKGAFQPDEQEGKALQDYLNTGGLVIFEAIANSDGANFLADAQKNVKQLLPDSATLEEVGSDKDLMRAAANTASVRAFKQDNGSLAVVFLPLAPETGGKGLPQSNAARAVYNMLFQKVAPEILDESYPFSVDSPEKSPLLGD